MKKKLVVLGMGVCVALAFASCKSSESAYKKAYEKAKQQELAEPQVEAPVEVTPVVAAPVETKKAVDNAAGVRQEKVTVVSGADGLKDYSVVCGSFGLKANAEGLKECRKLLTMAKAGKYNGYLLEGMACPGGCVAGAGTMQSIKKSQAAVNKYAATAGHKVSSQTEYVKELEKLVD